MDFKADRYDGMTYRRCGRSGLLLPAVSLGMWHNFGTPVSCRAYPARRTMRPSWACMRFSAWSKIAEFGVRETA